MKTTLSIALALLAVLTVLLSGCGADSIPPQAVAPPSTNGPEETAVRIVQFLPQDWADQMDSGGGLPEPNAPVIVEKDEPDDSRVTRYLFRHPANTHVRVTVVDYLTGVPTRVEGNEDIADMVADNLSTFALIQQIEMRKSDRNGGLENGTS